MNWKPFAAAALAVSLAAQQPPARSLTPAETALLRPISAQSMKAVVSFLAADALEGRDTPSKSLDVAAEYIASQFRRFGLDPAGDDGYFQTAPYAVVKPSLDGFEFTYESGAQKLTVPAAKVTIDSTAAVSLDKAAVVKVTLGSLEPSFTSAQIAGKVVFAGSPDFSAVSVEDRGKVMAAVMRDRQTLIAGKPALVVTAGGFGGGGRLKDTSEPTPPQFNVSDIEFGKMLRALPAGPTEGTVTTKLAAPALEQVKLRNVIGVVPGSDSALKGTYVLVTSHYDHTGMRTSGEGDSINNGANDDASGVAAMLEIADALSRSETKPKRTVVFAAYFGEEKGLLGSRFYGRHPVFPLIKTVADLNLEHMGRTDDNEGPQIKRLAVTGMDYSSVGDVLAEAGKLTGVDVWRHPKNSDGFFGASDNQALADVGVPAHTLSVAYIFPDYHRVGDHWDKLDYANMQSVTRTVCLGVWMIANDSKAPTWHGGNEKAKKYNDAWQRLHAGEPKSNDN